MEKNNSLPSEKFVLDLSIIGIKDLTLVGRKNASLGEMIQALQPKEINIPSGFVETKVFSPRNILFSKVQESDFEIAAKRVFADLHEQLLKAKGKMHKKKHAKAGREESAFD